MFSLFYEWLVLSNIKSPKNIIIIHILMISLWIIWCPACRLQQNALLASGSMVLYGINICAAFDM